MLYSSQVWASRRRWLRPGSAARAACLIALSLSAAYAAFWVPAAFERWGGESDERALARQAKRLAITYQDAQRRLGEVRGKPVRWFVTRVGAADYYGGVASFPIRWAGPAPDLPPADKHGAGAYVVGTVQGSGPDGVTLAFLTKE